MSALRATLHPEEQANLSRAADYSSVQAIPEIWPLAAQQFGHVVALHDPHSSPPVKITYAELAQQIAQFAAALQSLGVRPGEKIALIADNCPRWLVADQGIMTAGGVDAVRGTQADVRELQFIIDHSDSIALVVQDQATLNQLAGHLDLARLRFAILLTDEALPSETPLKVLNFSELMALGDRAPMPVSFSRDDLATLMFTSGTSGMPKGVMLSQGNLLSQISGACSVVTIRPGEKVMSILPIWHAYERSFEYFVLSQGCTQIYTNIRQIKKDLKTYQPKYMVAVPRLWESIYEGVQKQFREQPTSRQKLVRFFLKQSDRYIKARRTLNRLNLDDLSQSPLKTLTAGLQAAVLWPLHQLGDRLVYRKVREAMGGQVVFLVSGGGSIADYLEDFYEIVGIPILGGYGLTETSPITHVRRPWRNLRGADGEALPGTETAVVHPETHQPLPVGQQGLVLIRGPQVMQGYYKNPEATHKAISSTGWFDTGDLGKVTPAGDLIITGRAKDTIVLTNGENIEPQPIENACVRSPYVDQVMLVGQDQKTLGALVVPNFEALEQWAQEQGFKLERPGQPGSEKPQSGKPISLDCSPVQALFRQELNREVKNRPGYRADDRIGPFTLLDEPFTNENGLLTQTLKIRRPVVTEKYRDRIDAMFN